MPGTDPIYLGLDLSTQQLKCIAVNSDLKLIHEAKVDFDADLAKYGVEKGVLSNSAENEVYAPPLMWVEALELVLDRLRDAGLNFGAVQGVSGAGMQHGTVFWSQDAEALLSSLDAGKTMSEQLHPDPTSGKHQAFAHPYSPNWQDASTQEQCDRFDALLGGPEVLAKVTGSKAHHRFSGPQILRYRENNPSHYTKTAHISLVSSFLASLFLGKVAPIDVSDATGMNLWDIKNARWHEELLALVAGHPSTVPALKSKLGEVQLERAGSFGQVSTYFVDRFGFPPTTQIMPFTGDNPATILALPLRSGDAMVSLGTSTTFLMSTDEYKPDPAYHFMNHPTTPGLYMFMLCYKNGSLAREQIRNALNVTKSGNESSNSWAAFDEAAVSTRPLQGDQSRMRLGLYFPKPEIVPNVPAGQWRFQYDSVTGELAETAADSISGDARNIVESQMLSLRLRSHKLVHAAKDETTGTILPAQPRRIYLVGGGSANAAIAQICGEVLGSSEGVYRLDIGANACALGAAYKAVWGCERKDGESFEDFIGSRWDETRFVEHVAKGYKKGLFEQYGLALKGFELMEKEVQRRCTAATD